ncbi:hypothetical protein ACIP9H_35255 [Streptomyces sp. NPDC088732]|uniref:hypothetical protein n=1 Tax=Streptomyces sp. NPDC088732 TaxID=3365879 RepID=UPI003828ABD2
MINIKAARLGAEAARRLKQADCCEMEPGLTDDEFERVEAQYGFQFSDEHRAFLAAGLPVGSPPQEGATWDNPWPDWRNGDPAELRAHVAWPTEGILREVEHRYWHRGWGERPTEPQVARAVAERHLATVPRLAPVYAHRFLPAGREGYGHPLLSIWGTDIIFYGSDLAEYIEHEFNEDYERDWESWNPKATVPFWKAFLS